MVGLETRVGEVRGVSGITTGTSSGKVFTLLTPELPSVLKWF